MVAPPVEVPSKQKYFTQEDWILLDAMGMSPSVGTTGRFLTMHKRRRKKLTTRSLNDHAILDDIHHGQVQRILDQCGMWGFNAFTLETVAGGRSLPVLCVHLFHWYGLLEHFQLDVVRVWKLFTLIEEGYHSTNPYHNSIHATDVTQAMHCFLQEEKIKQHITPLEIMASLIGAVAHDLDHPGVNQHFLISTSNHLAILYENMSVLENHHWRSAVGCLLESGVAEQLLPYKSELENQIRDLILATDINRQQEFLTKFKKHLDQKTLELSAKDNRHFILQIALKCADISNPTRPWDISHKWSLKVCDEFFRQGEFERKLKLPVTSICDQQSTSVAKIQVGFFRFVVTPLFSEWHRFLKSSLSTYMMNLLESNRKRWETQEATEQAEETRTELSDAEPEQVITSDDDEDDVPDEEDGEERKSLKSPTFIDFIPPPTETSAEARRQSLAVPSLEHTLGVRRHSVPVNMEPTLPRTIYRRESLPTGRGTSQSANDDAERPLSAENLLPDTTIASITSSTAVARLSSVLQGGNANKALTRQQTFPPPQPYVRMRYMSATVEMSTCTETVHEVESRSSSSHSSHDNISAPQQYTIPSIAVLSPSNGRPPEVLITESGPEKSSSSSNGSNNSGNNNSNNNNKREQEFPEKEKSHKMAKFSEIGQKYEKENVDPRSTNSLSRRRGSVPVSLPSSRVDENTPPAGGGLYPIDAQSTRRGSVPVDVKQKVEDESRAMNVVTLDTYSLWKFQRRGSAPTDLPPPGFAERRDQLTRHTSLNGKAGRRKKQLHRRSSGGPETVCLPDSASDSWSRLFLRRNDNPEMLLAQRRGSLPIEVLTVGHSVF